MLAVDAGLIKFMFYLFGRSELGKNDTHTLYTARTDGIRNTGTKIVRISVVRKRS